MSELGFKFPIVIGMTTLPSRISKIRPCLDSLLSGKIVPDKILLALPALSIREKCSYSIPGFFNDNSFAGSVVEIVSADRDWGPGTKLLGPINFVPPDCYLVLADDDVRYRPSFLADIVSAQREDHSSSFSYYTYRAEGLTIGQGCDGFSFWVPNLSGIRCFAESYVLGTDLFFHDDLWISFYLASKGIAVKSLAHRVGPELIYETEHEINSLRYLNGSLGRDELNRSGVKQLISKYPLPIRTKLAIELTAIYDKLVVSQMARLRRAVGRRRS